MAKSKRDVALKKMRGKHNQQDKREYILLRNEYIKVRREEEQKYEENIIGSV